MTGVLWVVIPIAVVVGLYWLAYRIEPHWVSKDGRRFLCNVQPIQASGASEGRAMETRVTVLPDGILLLSQRRLVRRSLSETWRISGKSPNPPKRKAVYVLHPNGADSTAGELALRLPATSRAVPVLDEIIAGRLGR